MKDHQRQKRILDICDQVLDAPEQMRQSILNEECDSDATLLADVQTMLGRIDRADSDQTSSRDPLQLLGSNVSTVSVGDQVGEFTLLKEIGVGGMGSVFSAKRSQSGSDQLVAIKVLHAQIVTPELRLRFNIERDVLARLRHPYIAGLIDGGTTRDGAPFLAMELVEGLRIDEFCDHNKLSIADRVALLEKVGHALQHAHQNLIIHRDIKPSNVLVTSDGIPKLVDFGIAKILTNDAKQPTSHGATTYFGNQALTPDFASPEQLLEGKVSTASDIYSFGILATLLLTGRRPYDIDYGSPKAVVSSFDNTGTWRASDLISQIRSQADLRAIAEARNTTPTKIKKRFQGDLDTVLAKATHREPERRYLTSQEFAQDLLNHRKGKPVLARGDSLSYRGWSLMRTNKLAFSVIGATLAALSVGLVGALWQAQIAKERFNDLHQFARIVIGDVYDSVAELPGSTAARQLITEEAQHYLDRLAGEELKDDALLADLALAYRRIADVQGRPSGANLGQSSQALENYAKAAALADRITAVTPANTRARAQIYRRTGDLLAWQGNVEAGQAELQKSKAMLQILHETDLLNETARIDLAYNLINLGDMSGHPSFQNLGNLEQAASYYRQAIDLLQKAVKQSANRELIRSYSVALERSGTIALEKGSYELALNQFEASRDIRAQLAKDHPDHANIQRDAGIASEQIAKVQLRQKDTSGAIANFQKALDVYLGLFAIDPDNANAKRTVAIGRENMGNALLLNDSFSAANSQFAEAAQLLRELIKNDPSAPLLLSKLEAIDAKLTTIAEQYP